MPPYMAVPNYHLSRLPVTTKIGLTIFSLAILAALGFTAYPLFAERTGYTTKGVKVNYRGTEFLQEQGEIVEREFAAQSERQVYDLVHAHAFMIPVVFFILVHLMEMSYGARSLKIGLYLAAGASMLVIVFAPLLILRWLGAAHLMMPALAVMMATFGLMAVIPTVQMWTYRRPAL